MSGCGGCGPEGCSGPCSTRKEGVRDKYTLTDALAKVVVDNRVIVRAIELYEAGIAPIDAIVVQINIEKSEGRL